ncbi:MAG: divergent polysaccharide deacetylase family protein [Acidiferrobacterales bacterium]
MWWRAASTLAALAMFTAGPAAAGDQPSVAVIGIVMDDLGYSLADGERVIRLPGAVACAILPHTPYGERLARQAYAHHKEVILHLPMESLNETSLGPGALDSRMRALDIFIALQSGLQAVPHAAGVSNHMGSFLTQQPQAMQWLMAAIASKGDLFFVDSRTTAQSVAAKLAQEAEIPSLERDIFLDDQRDTDSIRARLDELLALARKRGTAVAIAHPYEETLRVLKERLRALPASGYRLARLGEILAIRARLKVPARRGPGAVGARPGG